MGCYEERLQNHRPIPEYRPSLPKYPKFWRHGGDVGAGDGYAVLKSLNYQGDQPPRRDWEIQGTERGDR